MVGSVVGAKGGQRAQKEAADKAAADRDAKARELRDAADRDEKAKQQSAPADDASRIATCRRARDSGTAPPRPNLSRAATSELWSTRA